ncbi:MAG: DUF4870 domain-containing protein [Nanoarchaeota archaeon]|nr:DUF4870 domain-containing protein [Nanoarchaeota archaeon]
MVNQDLVNYFKEDLAKGYSMDQLKQSLINQGYSALDVNEAANAVIGAAPISGPTAIPTKKGAAAIAYLLTWLTGLIVYLTADKDDKFTRFHGMQAILFGVSLIVLSVLFSIGVTVIGIFTGGLGFILFPLYWLVIVMTIIVMIVQTAKGKKIKLPLIGNWAENIVEKQ